MAGRHRRQDIPPDVRPTETRPDGSWLPADWLARAEGGAEALGEAKDATFAAFWDYAEDGELSQGSRERLVRAGRTLFQGALAAGAVAAAPVLLDALQGTDPIDWRMLAVSAGQTVLAALVAYVHPKRQK